MEQPNVMVFHKKFLGQETVDFVLNLQTLCRGCHASPLDLANYYYE